MSSAQLNQEVVLSKISLITACYNRESTIHDTLRSINEQTYENIEHIVIDGKSTDSSLDIIKSHGMRVSSLVSEKDDGFYDAYNKGLAIATGEIIGFLNSDDFYIANDVISKVMKIFEDPDIEACHANLVYVNFDNTEKVVRHWKSSDFTDKDYKKGSIPAHPTVFFRRSVYEKIGNFDTTFSLVADYDLLCRAFFVQKVKSVYVDETWIRMRVGGATGGNFKSIVKQNKELHAARKKHGIHTSIFSYILFKLFDRAFQFLRAGAAVPSDNKKVS